MFPSNSNKPPALMLTNTLLEKLKEHFGNASDLNGEKLGWIFILMWTG